MPLRVLELRVAHHDLEQVPDMLKEQPVVDVWRSEASGETDLLWILIDAAHVEALSDLLVGRLGSGEDFRLVVLPVEATLPPVKLPGETDAEDEQKLEPVPTELQRISREELYQRLSEASRLTAVYLVMVALSVVVAAIGLTRADVAITIGAMVIAPLLGPNIGLSLAATLGDLDLVQQALRTLGAGIVTAVVLATVLGIVLEVDPSAPELMARTQPQVTDFVLALAAGTAGALAFTSGLPTAVVGVTVSVALLPPLVGAGLLAGSGHLASAIGGLALVLTNVTCISLAAIATFLVQHVRPRTWWEAKRAQRATRIAVGIWVAMLLLLFSLIVLEL